MSQTMIKPSLPKTVWAPALALVNVTLALILATTTSGAPLVGAALMLGGPVAAFSAFACARRPRQRIAACLLAGTALLYGLFWSIIVFDQRHDQPPISETRWRPESRSTSSADPV